MNVRRLSRLPGPRLVPVLALLSLAAACGGSDDGGGGGPTEPPPPPSNADPVAAFTVQATGSSAPVGAAFDASGSSDPDGQVVSWSWSFGDGSTATGQVVEHVFDAPGSFTVQLTVTDDGGATAATSQTLEVTELAADQVAGVVWFDRNGDGVRQGSEEGVRDMTVFVDADGDGALDAGETRTTTGVGGIYQLGGLPGGEHRITQALSLGWSNTVPGAAPDPGPLRIIGGQDAPADSFPFMVSVQRAAEPDRHDAHICGGSLIAPQWVMTASHCLTHSDGSAVPPEAVAILLGTQRLDGSGTRVAVEETVINPGYSPAGGFYKRDISLVKLERRFEETPRIFLMDSTRFLARVEPMDDGTLIGWGLVEETAGGIPVELQVAPIPLRRNQDCEEAWNSPERQNFNDTMLCVGSISGTPNSCNGDSGGPWFFDQDGRRYQLGVVSWGFAGACNSPAFPSVFASVPAMHAFVIQNVPPEPSGAILVTVGAEGARADFGNFH